MRKILLIFVLSLNLNSYSQGVIIATMAALANKNVIPSKVIDNKYPLYLTNKKFDFNSTKIKIDFLDNRNLLNLKKVQCSEIIIRNNTEFSSETGARLVKVHLDSLFSKSNLIMNKNNFDALPIKVELNVLDSQTKGFISYSIHSICQMKFTFKEFTKTYCIDLVDGAANSPLSKDSVVTKENAIRIMTSASIRDVIEMFLNDLTEIIQ